MTSRRFTIMLSNVHSIKNKQDVVMELLEDSNANLAVLTETWLTDADDIWVQNSIDIITRLMSAIGEGEVWH